MRARRWWCRRGVTITSVTGVPPADAERIISEAGDVGSVPPWVLDEATAAQVGVANSTSMQHGRPHLRVIEGGRS